MYKLVRKFVEPGKEDEYDATYFDMPEDAYEALYDEAWDRMADAETYKLEHPETKNFCEMTEDGELHDHIDGCDLYLYIERAY